MAYSTETGNKNIEVLIQDLDLKQRIGGSVIFENEKIFVLSPSVQSKSNTFDINLVNVEAAKENQKKSLLIVRHFDNLLVGNLDDFLNTMTGEEYMYVNGNTRKWPYTVRQEDNNYFITLSRAKGLKFNLTKKSRESLVNSIGERQEKVEDKKETSSTQPQIDGLTFINKVYSHITSQGFSYSLDNIKNLYLSLRSKPFVIISGISGTGKTKIIQLFAEAVGATEENGQFKLIPVRPDWSDGSELLGYMDLRNEYQKGPFTEMVEHAMNNPELPFFVLLDEMNLARVEYYLSDVLSVMESRKRDSDKITTMHLLDKKYTGVPLQLPENLYIIGTVNMDETTQPFSKKVLDRANAIEFNEVDLENFSYLEVREEVTIQPIGNKQISAKYISLKDVYGEHGSFISKISRKLAEINELLKPLNVHVGYRVRDEICFYMIHNKEAGLLEENDAFDFCIMQKILPRIIGSDDRVDILLSDLSKWLAGESNETGIIEKSNSYPRSTKKVAEMLGRYHADGFTSFWIS